MTTEDFSPYLQKLLALYDEKRKRFRWTLSLLLVGAIAFFFLIFFPYLTLLGNRADCLAKQALCTELETSILDSRFTEFTTSWGNIPVSTSEIVVLFPALLALGFLLVSSQLVNLMQLRKAIQQQATNYSTAIDVTLIAPILLDPKRALVDLIAGGCILLVPVFVGLFSINVIYVRIVDLRNALPYAPGPRYYHGLYVVSVVIFLSSLARVGLEFLRFAKPHRLKN